VNIAARRAGTSSPATKPRSVWMREGLSLRTSSEFERMSGTIISRGAPAAPSPISRPSDCATSTADT